MPKNILIYGSIASWMAKEFITQVDELADSDLNVRINTEGGDVAYTYGMIAKFSEHAGAKSVHVDGQAYSMGAFFCCYAENVEALDVSQFMIHRASYGEWFEGSTFFTSELKANLVSMNKNLETAFRNKVDVEKFEALPQMQGKKTKDIFSMDSRLDVFMTAKEAKSIGLISKINTITPAKKAEIDNLMGARAAAVFVEPKQVEPKKKNMTIEQFKAEHPEAFAALSGQITAQERDRVGAWMTFVEVDPKAVAEGVKSGAPLGQTAMAEFSMKMVNGTKLAAVTAEAAPAVVTTPVVVAASTEKTEAEKLEAALVAELLTPKAE